jgi:hypothetical protein
VTAGSPPIAGCFADTMRPITPAEMVAWKFFLTMPRDQWRDARIMFRRVHNGTAPSDALIQLVASTGIDDAATVAALGDGAARLGGGRAAVGAQRCAPFSAKIYA